MISYNSNYKCTVYFNFLEILLGGSLKTKFYNFVLCVFLMCSISASFGASLGAIKVTSPIGEPLKIEIPILADLEELNSLVARVGSMDDYQRVGLLYGSAISDLKVRLDKSRVGEPVVVVFSKENFYNPVFDLLITLSWTGGRSTESYTVFVDSPEILAAFEKQTELENQKPDAISSSTEELENGETVSSSDDSHNTINDIQNIRGTVATPNGDRVEKIPATEAITDTTKSESLIEVDKFGPVSSGDTLGKIALQVKPEEVSLEKMLVLLFRKNPEAFVGANMNRLKVGPTLEIPKGDEYASISESEGVRLVKEQYGEWQAYKKQLAMAAQSSRVDESSNRQKVTGSVSSEGEMGAGQLDSPREVLRLSQDGQAGIKKTDSSSVTERVRELEEELVAKDNAVKDANARLVKLEKTIQDLKGLIEIENESLSDSTLPVDSDNSDKKSGEDVISEEETADIREKTLKQTFLKLINMSIDEVLSTGSMGFLKDHAVYEKLSSEKLGKKILSLPFYLFLIFFLLVILAIGLLIYRGVSTPKKVKSSRGNGERNNGKRKAETKNVRVTSDSLPKNKSPSIAEQKPASDLSGIDLDLDTVSDGELGDQKEGSKWYEVQTKFDLAKAYQEMGDRDGALQILMEVIAEGDEDQKAAAKQTISELDQ